MGHLQFTQLVVQGQTQDHSGGVHAYDPLVFSAEFHNVADHSSGPFQVEFVVDGHSTHRVDVQDVGPGQSGWAQLQHEGLGPGAHHVHLKFDGVQHTEHETAIESEEYLHEFVVAEPPPATGVAADSRDEDELATGYVNAMLGILRQWHYALLDFDKVMVSETQAAANPDFAGALLKVFEDKVLGELTKVTHADLVMGTLKAVVEASEKAKAASVSVALRNFYHQHLAAISEMDKHLVDAQEKFAPEMRARAATLLTNGDSDGYLAFRSALVAMHDAAVARLQGATLDAYVDDLSVEWMKQSIKDATYDVSIMIRIWEKDLSVIDFTIRGPDGDKLTEHLGAQQGGVDLWSLQVPREIAFYEHDGEYPSGWVHLDAANRLINAPAEQIGRYKEVYAALHSQGHLIGHGKP